MDTKTARKMSNSLKPVLQIGKNGLTEQVVQEIGNNLKKRRLIKIKCIKYHLDTIEEGTNKEKMNKTAEYIAGKLNAKVISVVGFNITLGKNIGSLREEDLK